MLKILPLIHSSTRKILPSTQVLTTMHVSNGDSRDRGDGLPGWGVYRGRCPALALFLSRLDILDLPAHGVPLDREVLHSQVLVRCGPVQAEHECWGQTDEGGSQRWETQIDKKRRDGQPVTQADGNRSEGDGQEG